MKKSAEILQKTIDSLLRSYRYNTGSSPIKSVSYVQIDPMSRLQGEGCNVQFETKTGQIHGFFFQADLIAKAYYDHYFPYLKPISFEMTNDIDISNELPNFKALSSTSAMIEGHNILIIPAFAALNRIALFIIDLDTQTIEASEKDTSSVGFAPILSNAQQCHLDICNAQSAFNIEKARLTHREKETLLCVVKGQSNTEIACTLGLSLHTVTGYLRNIYLKTQTRDRTSAAIYALHEGLLHGFENATAQTGFSSQNLYAS